jgi:hypothetical protein
MGNVEDTSTIPIIELFVNVIRDGLVDIVIFHMIARVHQIHYVLVN